MGSIKGRYKAPFKDEIDDSRPVSTRASTARIIYFHYDKQNFGVASSVRPEFRDSVKDKIVDRLETTELWNYGVIEEEIDTISISKSLRNPSANFTISLFPNKNWKKSISPGDWILVYLYYDDNRGEYLGGDNGVLIGNVDRISRIREKDEETDKVLLRYKISGRNFGKIFEETDLWFDPYLNQEKILETTLRTKGLPLTGSPDKLVNTIMDVFLGEGGTTEFGKTSPLGQWRVPAQLIYALTGENISGTNDFNTILKRDIVKGLPGVKVRQMISPRSNGNLWEALKRGSNSLINEIFLEERRDGKTMYPSITLRPRPYNTPFFDSQFGTDIRVKSELKGKYKTLQGMSRKPEDSLEISSKEILYDDLGFDDHSRFNMFWLSSRVTSNEAINSYANLGMKGDIKLPMISRESIERYGLKRFEQEIDFCYLEGTTSTKSLAVNLYKAFMAQIYDFYYANHLYEQGTIETYGVLEAELGKCLKVIPENDYERVKLYYVEGYDHSWSSLGKWTTTWTLTRGQFQMQGFLNVFIDQQYDDFGADDEMIDTSYLVRSKTERF